MPKQTVSQRTRAKLFDLFRDRTRFSKTALANYCNKPPSWVSNFLHPNASRTERPSFHLDELDDIANYFRISLGELLGAPKAGELSGDEQRLLHAFRVLPTAVQEHFLGIIEQASLGSRFGTGRPIAHRAEPMVSVKAELDRTQGRPPHADLSPATAAELARLVARAQAFLRDAAAVVETFESESARSIAGTTSTEAGEGASRETRRRRRAAE